MQRRDIHIHIGRDHYASELHVHISGDSPQDFAPLNATTSSEAVQFLGSGGDEAERAFESQSQRELPSRQRIAPRLYSLELAAQQTFSAERTVMSEGLHVLDRSPVTLERVSGTGLYSHRWEAIAPAEAAGGWILEVSRHFDRLQCVITLRNQSFLWFAPEWRPNGPVILEPLSPRTILEHLPRLQLTPTLSVHSAL